MKDIEKVNPRKLWRAIEKLHSICKLLEIDKHNLSEEIGIIDNKIILSKRIQNYLVDNKVIILKPVEKNETNTY